MKKIPNEDLKMLKQVCQNTDSKAYEIIKNVANYLHNEKSIQKPTSLHLMIDAAHWTYDEAMKNLNSKAAKSIKMQNALSYYHASKVIELGLTTVPEPVSSAAQFLHAYLAAEAKFKAYKEWISQVAAGKAWDLKAQRTLKKSNEYLYDPPSKTSYRRDIWGNIHYGYIGLAIGFSADELHSGAGIAQLKTMWAQKKKGDSDSLDEGLRRVLENYGDPGALDPPDDKAAVQVGIDLWSRRGSSLAFRTFIKDIRKNRSLLATK